MTKNIKVGVEAAIEITEPPAGITKKATLSIFGVQVAYVVRDITTPDAEMQQAVQRKFALGIAKAVAI